MELATSLLVYHIGETYYDRGEFCPPICEIELYKRHGRVGGEDGAEETPWQAMAAAV